MKRIITAIALAATAMLSQSCLMGWYWEGVFKPSAEADEKYPSEIVIPAEGGNTEMTYSGNVRIHSSLIGRTDYGYEESDFVETNDLGMKVVTAMSQDSDHVYHTTVKVEVEANTTASERVDTLWVYHGNVNKLGDRRVTIGRYTLRQEAARK